MDTPTKSEATNENRDKFFVEKISEIWNWLNKNWGITI